MRHSLLIITILLSCILPLTGHTQERSSATPQRIISLGPINTENIYLLGAGDRLVGNTNYCVRPEAAKEKEKIGSVMQVSIEKIIGLRPDLVLATAMTNPSQIKQLQAAGLNIVQFSQPASFVDICAQFLTLGQLLGREKLARQIILQASEQVKAVQKQVARFPKQKVFLQVGSQPLFASVPNSFTHDFIELAGGINIASDQKSGTTNYEKVIISNPDVIIVAIMGSESGIAAQEKAKWQRVSVIKAMQKDRVHVINPDLICSPSPISFAETLTIMAGLIHPELDQEKI